MLVKTFGHCKIFSIRKVTRYHSWELAFLIGLVLVQFGGCTLQAGI